VREKGRVKERLSQPASVFEREETREGGTGERKGGGEREGQGL